MVTTALEALVGSEPDDEAVAAALATIPAAELPDALRRYAREHGAAALPVLRRCLASRPDWAVAAAAALGTVAAKEAAATLAAAEVTAGSKAVRTALRRALYRLRQAGITPPPPPAAPRVAPAPPQPTQAWLSAVDGTGTRGLWLVLEGPPGEHTLLSAVVSDTVGVLDGAGGPLPKKRIEERLRALRADGGLPWVAVPPDWAVTLLTEASARRQETGVAVPRELARQLSRLEPAVTPAPPPIYARIAPPSGPEDATLLDHSAGLLTLPELAGWFLDPPAVASEALDLLQAKESRLVISDQIKAERTAALVDRVIAAQFTPETRRLWQRRLEETAWVLVETGRPIEARRAVAVARALGDPERAAHHVPFVRALVERSLEVAGEVALGRLRGDEVSRRPRAPHPVTAS